MIYVASAYTHKDPAVREARFKIVRDWVMSEIKATGLSLFAPIAYTHEYARDFGMPFDAKFWYNFNKGFIIPCSEMWVLMMPGWKDSVGIQGEIDLCNQLGIPVVYKELPA